MRLRHLRAELAAKGLEGILLTHLPDIFYFAGFRGSDGALWVDSERLVLLVDGRYGTQAKEQAPSAEVHVYARKASGIADVIKASGRIRVGYESRHLSVELFEMMRQATTGVQWEPCGEWVHALRARKDEAEMSILRRANRIADEALTETLASVRLGMTEKDLADELEHRMKRRGAEGASFPILVAGGERAALPHARPTDRPLADREIFFVDFGCTLEGYQTDQTVTLSMGEPSEKMREIYRVVKDAHDLAIAELRPGRSVREIDSVARTHIEKAGLGSYFTHSLGHGVGIEVHEFPLLSSRSDDLLEAGMVVTIEPGVYIPGLGGVRIEDALFVTAEGAERLTGLDKELRCL